MLTDRGQNLKKKKKKKLAKEMEELKRKANELRRNGQCRVEFKFLQQWRSKGDIEVTQG